MKNKIIRFTCKSSDLLLLPYYVICCFFICRYEAITKLEDVILTIVEDISQNKPPSLKYNCRNSWKNTR